MYGRCTLRDMSAKCIPIFYRMRKNTWKFLLRFNRNRHMLNVKSHLGFKYYSMGNNKVYSGSCPMPIIYVTIYLDVYPVHVFKLMYCLFYRNLFIKATN